MNTTPSTYLAYFVQLFFHFSKVVLWDASNDKIVLRATGLRKLKHFALEVSAAVPGFVEVAPISDESIKIGKTLPVHKPHTVVGQNMQASVGDFPLFIRPCDH